MVSESPRPFQGFLRLVIFRKSRKGFNLPVRPRDFSAEHCAYGYTCVSTHFSRQISHSFFGGRGWVFRKVL